VVTQDGLHGPGLIKPACWRDFCQGVSASSSGRACWWEWLPSPTPTSDRRKSPSGCNLSLKVSDLPGSPRPEHRPCVAPSSCRREPAVLEELWGNWRGGEKKIPEGEKGMSIYVPLNQIELIPPFVRHDWLSSQLWTWARRSSRTLCLCLPETIRLLRQLLVLLPLKLPWSPPRAKGAVVPFLGVVLWLLLWSSLSYLDEFLGRSNLRCPSIWRYWSSAAWCLFVPLLWAGGQAPKKGDSC